MKDFVKKELFSKKTLYTLCFVAFAFIDWARGSQTGPVWAWAVNMTGVVVAIIMFSAYSWKDLKKPIYLIYSIVCIGLLIGSYYWWNLNQAAIYRDKLLTAVLNVWFLGMAAILLFYKVKIEKTVKLKITWLEIVGAVCLLWMFFSVNEDVWPIWYLILFGLFYLTRFSREDLEALLQGLMNGMILGFFLIQGLAFVFRPFDYIRYAGMYSNFNMNGLFYAMSFLAFLCKSYSLRVQKKKWGSILCWLFAASCITFTLYTMCRTALITELIGFFAYGIVCERKILGDQIKKILVRWVTFGLVIILALPITYLPMRYLPPVFHHPIWYEGEWREDKVQSSDPVDSWKYEEFWYVMDQLMDKFYIHTNFHDYFSSALKFMVLPVHAEELPVTSTSGKPVTNSVSNDNIIWGENGTMRGRQLIYRVYLQNATMYGHPLRDSQFRIGESFYVWHAQNAVIQVLFLYGIPAGLMYLAIMITLLIKTAIGIYRGKMDYVIYFMILLIYAIFGLMEPTWYPGQIVLLIFMIIPKFLLYRKDNPDFDLLTGK